jgi:hypothetical protein
MFIFRNIYAQRSLPTADFPLLLDSGTASGLNYQILTATAYNNRQTIEQYFLTPLSASIITRGAPHQPSVWSNITTEHSTTVASGLQQPYSDAALWLFFPSVITAPLQLRNLFFAPPPLTCKNVYKEQFLNQDILAFYGLIIFVKIL